MTVTATKYAKVLWELQLSEDALHTTGGLLAADDTLRAVLCDPTVHREQKHRVVERIFPKETVNFMKVLCDEQDVALFDEICEAYEQLKNEKDHTVQAQLQYVTPPTASQADGMKDFLKEYFGAKDVLLEQKEDASLLGGFILSARNQEWDWSLRGRIAQLSEDLSRR